MTFYPPPTTTHELLPLCTRHALGCWSPWALESTSSCGDRREGGGAGGGGGCLGARAAIKQGQVVI